MPVSSVTERDTAEREGSPADSQRPDSGAETAARVLVVEDEGNIRELVRSLLEDEGYAVQTAEDGYGALKAMDGEVFDVVLLDINLPGPDGLTLLGAAPNFQADAQFIMMTAFGSVDSAVKAMKLGAFDYLRKPFKEDELLVAIRRAVEQLELRREVARLRRKASGTAKTQIVGKSSAMERVLDLVERVAPTRATVLIHGETGTGKELVARAIHDLSDRSKKPFVPVNCSALPESLLESELFGHVKGAFTGAVQSRRGLFEEASGGTLFLDEISTVSPAIQVKLLRVIQERKIQRVGGGSPIPVDFRLLVATNRDLEELVREGNFREDLYYRLNVFPIRVPPLRERKEDIPLLAHHFRVKFAEENGVDAPELPARTLSRMQAYDWPGNVRELENFVERSVILHGGGSTIPFDPASLHELPPAQELAERAAEEEWDLERLEREHIVRTLDRLRWHQGNAAEVLGINRRTLYRKLKKYREQGHIDDH